MSLHDRIMALPDYGSVSSPKEKIHFVDRNEAAHIAKEADARIAELEQCLKEARENIESWADYVPEMFRDKHDLQGDLAAIDRVLGGGDAKA